MVHRVPPRPQGSVPLSTKKHLEFTYFTVGAQCYLLLLSIDTRHKYSLWSILASLVTCHSRCSIRMGNALYEPFTRCFMMSWRSVAHVTFFGGVVLTVFMFAWCLGFSAIFGVCVLWFIWFLVHILQLPTCCSWTCDYPFRCVCSIKLLPHLVRVSGDMSLMLLIYFRL